MVGSRVYVGGLPYGTTERDLERFFRGYGRMKDVLIKNGYGFVEFDDYRDADDAVYELNGKKLLGERVTVERARGTPRGRDQWNGGGSSGGSGRDYRSDRYGPPTRTNHRLIVENLSSRVSWQDLKDFMRQAGEVTYADAHKQHRNEGVVEFASHSDLRSAIDKLNDSELNGRRIRLIEDKSTRRHRSGSYSSRSRSRSRSRRSKSKSRSRSRRSSRSKSKSRSKSRSVSPKKGRSKSKSRSAGRSRSKSAKKSEERSRSRSRSRSASRKKSIERSRSRSRSRSEEKRSRSRSRSKPRSKSREPENEKSKSRSRSPSKERSKSRSPRSRSRSHSDN